MRTRILLLMLVKLSVYAASSYDTSILSDNPVLYLRMSALQSASKELDRSGHGNSGTSYKRKI